MHVPVHAYWHILPFTISEYMSDHLYPPVAAISYYCLILVGILFMHACTHVHVHTHVAQGIGIFLINKLSQLKKWSRDSSKPAS